MVKAPGAGKALLSKAAQVRPGAPFFTPRLLQLLGMEALHEARGRMGYRPTTPSYSSGGHRATSLLERKGGRADGT
jgi:hypothetical protein